MRPIIWIYRVEPKARAAFAFSIFLGLLSYLDFASFAQTKAPAPAAPGPVLTKDQTAFFESKIRPVLVKSCYGCHAVGAKEVEGGLLLDTRQALLHGGEDGPVIVPGNPDRSRLIEAIRYGNKDLQMPPDDGGGKLPDSVIHDFEAWVKMGAPDPRDGGIGTITKAYDTTEAKKWWSFQPLKRPARLTDVSHADWTRGEIDRYVSTSLSAKNLKPVGDADKQTLIRRVYFDLIGLPPTPEEVDAFVKNDSPDAFEKIVDDLLARPQFGEHWGRHWLDVARYAESAGKEHNATFPNAWRYRDYVIAAFNQDKPYNTFVREQIAGDLLLAPDPKRRAEQLIATGFLAIGPKGLSEQASRQFDLDLADEQVDATSQAFIGLTVSCARCHDHKFDPVLQRDYYAMAGIFLSTRTDYGTIPGPGNNQESEQIELPANANLPEALKNLTPEEFAKLKKDLADATAEYDQLLASRGPVGRRGARLQQQQQPPADRGNVVQLANQIRVALGKKAKLESQLNSYDESGHPKPFCMGVQDRPPTTGRVMPMPPVQTGPNGNAIKRQLSGFETIADSPLFFRGEMSDPRRDVGSARSGSPRVPGISGLDAFAGNYRARKRPQGTGRLDCLGEESTDGAGDGQSNLVLALWPGDRRLGGQLRHHGRFALQPGPARISGEPVDRQRLVDEEIHSGNRPQPRLSIGLNVR
jgi:cytochrome c553